MILILTPFFAPGIGGVETHLNDLCGYLNREGLKTSVLTYRPITVSIRAPHYEVKENLEIRRFWWPGSNLFHKFERFPPVFNFSYLTPGLLLRSFGFMLRANSQIEVIHAQGLVAGFVGAILKLTFKKRLVISTHAIYGLRRKTLFSKIAFLVFNSADKVLALSQASKEELLKLGLKDDKIKVYTYWVDQKIFRPGNKIQAKKTLGFGEKFVVLFVGRLIPLKGASLLVKIAEKEPEIDFVFIGIGPCEEELRMAARRLPNLKFLGKIENQYLPAYYQAADVLAVPSLYEEGFGRVILEALSCGLPVIGSKKGGIPEAVDETVGILVPPNEKAFRHAIKGLFNDRSKLEALSHNCCHYAVRKFSEKNAALILRCYHDFR